jgi:hypothetical protein
VLGPAGVMPAAAALYTHYSLRSAVLMLAALGLGALLLTLAVSRRTRPDPELTGRPRTKSA